MECKRSCWANAVACAGAAVGCLDILEERSESGITVKSVTMISWEFEPYYIRGGTAYAIRRLADQLIDLGIETRVLVPDRQDAAVGHDLTSMLVPLRMRPEFD